jgi:hypothetical protein
MTKLAVLGVFALIAISSAQAFECVKTADGSVRLPRNPLDDGFIITSPKYQLISAENKKISTHNSNEACLRAALKCKEVIESTSASIPRNPLNDGFIVTKRSHYLLVDIDGDKLSKHSNKSACNNALKSMDTGKIETWGKSK